MTGPGRKSVTGLIVVAAAVAIGVVVYDGDAESDGNEPRPATFSAQAERVRVEVLNRGGVSGMAGAATHVLRAAGFDVVGFGNVSVFDTVRVSEVIDRVGRTDIAQAVAKELGIDNVQSDPNPNLYVDVSVLLGREWAGPNGGSKVDEAAEARPWWDPRTWFDR